MWEVSCSQRTSRRVKLLTARQLFGPSAKRRHHSRVAIRKKEASNFDLLSRDRYGCTQLSWSGTIFSVCLFFCFAPASDFNPIPCHLSGCLMVKHSKRKAIFKGWVFQNGLHLREVQRHWFIAVNVTQLMNTTMKDFCTQSFNLYPFYATLCSQGEKISPFP